MSHVHDCTAKTSVQVGRSAGYGPKAKVLLLQTPVKSEKEGRQWLRKHPMEYVVWAASKARVDTDEEESSDDDDEDAERNTPNDCWRLTKRF